MRISDWSSDVCSSDLQQIGLIVVHDVAVEGAALFGEDVGGLHRAAQRGGQPALGLAPGEFLIVRERAQDDVAFLRRVLREAGQEFALFPIRSEEHTSELQSLMRISYAVFCLKKKKTIKQQ